MGFRLAQLRDCCEILSIYQAYIDTNVTFEYTLPSAADFMARMQAIMKWYPFVVYEEEGEILGYAYAHALGSRAAYQWSAALSVYLKPAARGKQVGTKSYQLLMALLSEQGIQTVYGLVTSDNQASMRLHEQLGFIVAGVQKNVGYKNNQWLDVVYYERPIGCYSLPALSCRGIDDIDAQGIIRRFNARQGAN